MTRGKLLGGLARRLSTRAPAAPALYADYAEPAAAPAPAPVPAPAAAAEAGPRKDWPGVSEQFALRILALAEQLRPELDRLEADEDDSARLQQLYRVDHAVTRMRRAARDLRVLAGGDEELTGYTSSLVDVIRVAESSIERYTQVGIGTVADLAVVGYAADDVAALLAALMDNATRYSPATVTVSGHLLEDGGVMFRVEDCGIGMDPAHLAHVNTVLSGPPHEVDEWTGRHTGFPVVHRLARKHGIKVRLAGRSQSPKGAAGGTIAMVIVPPQLLCEIPAQDPSGTSQANGAQAPRRTAAYLTMARRPAVRPGPAISAPRPVSSIAPGSSAASAAAPVAPGTGPQLPRRQRMSLREAGSAGRRRPADAEDATDPPDPGASARAFAADLNAFTTGDQDARQESARQESTRPASGSDDDPEEQVP